MRLGIAFGFLIACSTTRPPQPWPAGDYCVLRANAACPRATNGVFEEGSIVIDTDNGVELDDAGASSELRDDDNDGLLSLEVCCGSFSDVGSAFPSESFVVLAGGFSDAPSCPAGFTPGSVYIDAEDNEAFGDNADSFARGNVGASSITVNSNVDLIVCESGGDPGGIDMPQSAYCVFGGRNSCPGGFSLGSIITNDEASGNTNEIFGTVGGITQSGARTSLPICCN